METLDIFLLQFVMSLLAVSLLAKNYLSPRLNQLSTEDGLAILIAPHMFRHLGLVFLVPGVVAADMPGFFAETAAYGDLTTAVLAVVAFVALKARSPIAIPMVWIFSIAGLVDLANALRQVEAVPHFDAAWYIPTFVVPVLLVTHALVIHKLYRHHLLRDVMPFDR